MITETLKISKIAMFTDIHFGAKSNSETHNQDCLKYINWFCENVKKDKDIDAIAFLGDWNENRSALNIATLNFSYKGAKMINDLGLPVLFVIGNHDLYHKHTREVHSIIPFNEFSNFILVSEPTFVKNLIGDDILFCPFMFHDEYEQLGKHLNIPIWMGHFEFKGFEVTGYGMKMPTGPDPEAFKGPKVIFSGHFHKRQAYENTNIVYIGNAFPTNFGDAGEVNRGMAIYDFNTEDTTFINWKECPKYIKTTLSELLDNTKILYQESRVKCLVDIPVSFEESNYLRKKFIDDYHLRELNLEESPEIREVIVDTEVLVDLEQSSLASIDEMVQAMLANIDSKHINNNTLIEIYNKLK